MEEKLVSYEVAKLAHELGFCEKVLFGIKESGDHFVGKGLYDWNGDKTTTCFSCPSHGHLYKWIMKHGIYIDIETIISRGKVAFKVVIQYGECLKCVKVLPKNYECYDSAWDAGLLYALRLICDGHKHCKHDDCCDDHEHKHEHCDKDDHCKHDHKHDDCDDDDCEKECKHDHKDDCDDKDKCEHDHEHEHDEHHEHTNLHMNNGNDFEIDQEKKDEHDKKPGKGK